MADAGSSVPEAARAAARKAWADYIGEDPSALPRAVTRALDVALAAAVAEERATTGRLRVDVTPEAVEALRLAADNMPLRREGEPYAGAADWLRRRAAGFEDAIGRAALASPGEGE